MDATRGKTPRNRLNRYRLPGIDREGVAQLSLLETALWPLDPHSIAVPVYQTTYPFQVDGQRRLAHVAVRSAAGLQPNDEYVLWGLLGISLASRDPDPVLFARPYWLLRQLGMPTGGSQYRQFRDAIERLAMTAYQNTAFYNPLTQEHERATFHFFTTFIPTVGPGGPEDTERSWRIEWSSYFHQMCKATGGSLLFDLDLYRQLSPASRRLFLKLKDRFWRTKRVHLNVDDLTVNGLGFSPTRPLRKRKYDLTRCIRELLDHGIVTLGHGQSDPKEIFIKRGKGSYVAVFYEGPYFRKAPPEQTSSPKAAGITDDPLYEPLKSIGFEQGGISHILRTYSRGVIQRWIKITETAMRERPRAFPGFKVSPMAFCMDGITHNRMPPDWVYAHEKEQRRQQWEAETVRQRAEEQELRNAYEKARETALKAFLEGEGREPFAKAYAAYSEIYRASDATNYHTRALEGAISKVEAEHFTFPEFSTWALNECGSTNPAILFERP